MEGTGLNHPIAKALKAASYALAPFGLRDLKLTYTGRRDNVLVITAQAVNISGVNVDFEIPVAIKQNEAIRPEVIRHEGSIKLIARSTFADMLDRKAVWDEYTSMPKLFSPNRPERKPTLRHSRPGGWARVSCVITQDIPELGITAGEHAQIVEDLFGDESAFCVKLASGRTVTVDSDVIQR